MFLIFSGKRTIFLKGWFALAHEHKYKPTTQMPFSSPEPPFLLVTGRGNEGHFKTSNTRDENVNITSKDTSL